MICEAEPKPLSQSSQFGSRRSVQPDLHGTDSGASTESVSFRYPPCAVLTRAFPRAPRQWLRCAEYLELPKPLRDLPSQRAAVPMFLTWRDNGALPSSCGSGRAPVATRSWPEARFASFLDFKQCLCQLSALMPNRAQGCRPLAI